MTNQEIQNKINELIAKDNICDIILGAKEFDVEYKKSDFYKQTKIGFLDLIKTYKQIMPIDINKLFKEIQDKINELDLTGLNNTLDAFIKEGVDLTQDFKDGVKEFKQLV